MVSLAACGGPLSLLTGGGPNVAANVQAGQTNTQTVGQTRLEDQRITKSTIGGSLKQSNDTSQVKADRVDSVTVNQTPLWIVLLLVIGWILPSPQEMVRWLLEKYKQKKTPST